MEHDATAFHGVGGGTFTKVEACAGILLEHQIITERGVYTRPPFLQKTSTKKNNLKQNTFCLSIYFQADPRCLWAVGKAHL